MSLEETFSSILFELYSLQNRLPGEKFLLKNKDGVARIYGISQEYFQLQVTTEVKQIRIWFSYIMRHLVLGNWSSRLSSSVMLGQLGRTLLAFT